MQKISQSQVKGFAVTSVLLVVLLVGVVGFAGWFVYQNNQDTGTDTQATTQEESVPATASVPINSTEDIDGAITELESVPIEADLDTTQLDEDINSVL